MTEVFVSCGMLPEDEIVALAPEIERLGFDGITLGDHVFIAGTPGSFPYSADGRPPFAPDAPWPDPFVVMGALATVTERIRFMTTVVILPLRHPLLVAKAVAAAARISRGRVLLGVGVGWQREEYEALRVDFTKRGAIADEAIAVLRKLWQPGPVEHHGPFFSFGPLHLEPQPPPVPIIVGGRSEAARRRAVRLGDGYVLPAPSSHYVASVRGLLAERGRTEEEFQIIVPSVMPSASELERILDLHASIVSITPWPLGVSHEVRVEHLQRCAHDVLACVRTHDGRGH
jgi:probable F420-dependent oxidoreductase